MVDIVIIVVFVAMCIATHPLPMTGPGHNTVRENEMKGCRIRVGYAAAKNGAVQE
jgi:hypothetical protein